MGEVFSGGFASPGPAGGYNKEIVGFKPVMVGLGVPQPRRFHILSP